jgi:hypothetical protein
MKKKWFNRMRTATRQASSSVSDTAVAISRSACAATVLSPSGEMLAAATNASSASPMDSLRRSIRPSVNISRVSPGWSSTRASS